MNYLKAIEKLENEKQYLLYYKRNVIDDLHHLAGTFYNYSRPKGYIIIKQLMNKEEFKHIKHLLKKYRKNAIKRVGGYYCENRDEMLEEILFEDPDKSYYWLIIYYGYFLKNYIDYIDYKIKNNYKKYVKLNNN